MFNSSALTGCGEGNGPSQCVQRGTHHHPSPPASASPCTAQAENTNPQELLLLRNSADGLMGNPDAGEDLAGKRQTSESKPPCNRSVVTRIHTTTLSKYIKCFSLHYYWKRGAQSSGHLSVSDAAVQQTTTSPCLRAQQNRHLVLQVLGRER